jgi:uncharacterized membrane protein YqjE
MMSQRYNSPPESDRSLSELFSEMTTKIQLLLRKEVELAKLETTEQLSKAGKAGAMFGAAGVIAFLALLLLSFAAAWGLAAVLPTGVAFLIVGVVFLALAGLLGMQGRKRVAGMRPPEQTVKTLKDDVQVAKRSLQRGVKDDGPSGRR